MVILMPKDSAKIIHSLADHVKINEEGIDYLAEHISDAINDGTLSVTNFSQNQHHPKCTDPNAIDWIFVVDTLNFCFWKQEGEPGWIVDGHSGYFGLCAAINRAVKENYDITNPKYYSTISKEDLEHILRSDNNVKIPLFDERLKALHEVGGTLLKTFDGSFVNCVNEANKSAKKLLQSIVTNFNCFKDEAYYKLHTVSFYKRAQILIADIWACFQNEDLGHFKDIDEITMFADYRVPQSLLYFHVLEYDDEITDLLKSNTLLENGSEYEIEIRGCSIEAVEQVLQIVREMVNKEKIVNAILIDHFLWDFRRAHAKEIIEEELPFHKTLCIYY